MLITQRDQQIIDLIELTGAVKTSHIQRLFMKNKSQGKVIAERRLKSLYSLGMVHRTRAFINTEYIYYKKKTLLEHKLALTELYIALLDLPGEILKFEVEKQIGDIRPDALCDYLYQNNVYQFFIEIHLAKAPFNQQKYEDFYSSGKYREIYKVFPRVIIVSDRQVDIKASKIRYIKIPLNCSGIYRILK
jgi:hypothetical protein